MVVVVCFCCVFSCDLFVGGDLFECAVILFVYLTVFWVAILVDNLIALGLLAGCSWFEYLE